MKRCLYLILFSLCFLQLTQAQGTPPNWVRRIPNPTNSTYLYVMESAEGTSEISARNQAFARVFQSTAMRLGQPINSDDINRAVQRGTSFDVISRQYNIPINKVCEYTVFDKGRYVVYILCQVAKAGNISVQFDQFNNCYEGANRPIAGAALASDGFDVYKNNRRMSEWEVRSLFANSRAYSYYDRGMSIIKSDFWKKNSGLSTSEGIGYCVLAAGGTAAVVGYLFGSMTDEQHPEDKESLESVASAGMGICGIAGVIFLIRFGVLTYGKTNIRKAVNTYNNGDMYSQKEVELHYGLTGNGVYLGLRF